MFVLSPTLFLLFVNNFRFTPLLIIIIIFFLSKTRLFIFLLILNLFLLFHLKLLFDFNLANLDRISPGGTDSTLKNSTPRILLQHISSQKHSHFSYYLDGSLYRLTEHSFIFGLNTQLPWILHITSVNKMTSKKVEIIFRMREFFLPKLISVIQGFYPPLFRVVLIFRGQDEVSFGIRSRKLLSISLNLLSRRSDVGAHLSITDTTKTGWAFEFHYHYVAVLTQWVSYFHMNFVWILITRGFLALLVTFQLPLFRELAAIVILDARVYTHLRNLRFACD